MARYATELEQTITNLSTSQVANFCQSLTLPEIIILRAAVLSQFKEENVQLRQALEAQLNAQQQGSIDDVLAKLYFQLVTDQVLAKIKNDATQAEFIKFSSDETLSQVSKFFAFAEHNPHASTLLLAHPKLLDAIKQEQQARAEQKIRDDSKGVIRAVRELFAAKDDAELTELIKLQSTEQLNKIESYLNLPENQSEKKKAEKLLDAIHLEQQQRQEAKPASNAVDKEEKIEKDSAQYVDWGKVNSALDIAEIVVKSNATPTVSVEQRTAANQEQSIGFFQRVLNFFGFGSSKPERRAVDKAQVAALYAEDEQSAKVKEACVDDGADKIAKEIGKRDQNGRDRNKAIKTMQARFGMSIAQQMVASSELSGHGKMTKVMDSLLDVDATEEQKKTLRKALSQLSLDDNSPINPSADHIFSEGGQSYLVTELESDIVNKLLIGQDGENEYGIDLSDSERI